MPNKKTEARAKTVRDKLYPTFASPAPKEKKVLIGPGDRPPPFARRIEMNKSANKYKR